MVGQRMCNHKTRHDQNFERKSEDSFVSPCCQSGFQCRSETDSNTMNVQLWHKIPPHNLWRFLALSINHERTWLPWFQQVLRFMDEGAVMHLVSKRCEASGCNHYSAHPPRVFNWLIQLKKPISKGKLIFWMEPQVISLVFAIFSLMWTNQLMKLVSDK